MIFNIHPLQNPLKDYVESIFHFKDFMPDHSIERVVPTGHIFILFELDGIPRHTFDNETLKPNQTYTKVWISGIHKNYISISAPQNSEMFVIQFKPLGAFPFFHFPIERLNEKIVPAETILGKEILANSGLKIIAADDLGDAAAKIAKEIQERKTSKIEIDIN